MSWHCASSSFLDTLCLQTLKLLSAQFPVHHGLWVEPVAAKPRMHHGPQEKSRETTYYRNQKGTDAAMHLVALSKHFRRRIWHRMPLVFFGSLSTKAILPYMLQEQAR